MEDRILQKKVGPTSYCFFQASDDTCRKEVEGIGRDL